MKIHETIATPFVAEVTCDRCGAKARYNEDCGFNNFEQIGFDAGWGSSIGDGVRVDIDLCHDCLKQTLGPWLRLSKSDWVLTSDGEATRT